MNMPNGMGKKEIDLARSRSHSRAHTQTFTHSDREERRRKKEATAPRELTVSNRRWHSQMQESDRCMTCCLKATFNSHRPHECSHKVKWLNALHIWCYFSCSNLSLSRCAPIIMLKHTDGSYNQTTKCLCCNFVQLFVGFFFSFRTIPL